MATKFLEPGGDATFNVATTANGGFWTSLLVGTPTIETDFVHGGHIKSIKFAAGATTILTKSSTVQDSGSRISLYIYLVALPSSDGAIIGVYNAGLSGVIRVKIKDTGVIHLANGSDTNIGTDGATLSTGVWYRISLAYTITSTTINRLELFVDGVSSISITNATFATITGTTLGLGNIDGDATLDLRISDVYVDDSSSLTDTGNIYVTAKRPNANGTTNGFTTQVGAGGSGYGSGHSPQVNERALSTTNGWSMVGAGSAVVEEYTIESASTGDRNLTGATIIDLVGWAYASSLLSETGKIIVINVETNISLTSTNTMFTKVAGSASYPAGGTDIGIKTSTDLTTVSLYECGIMIAYIPAAVVSTTNAPFFGASF